MTKFILHGGRISRPTPNNKKFFSEIIKGLPEPVEVLCVYFAQEKEKWTELFEIRGKKIFSSFLPKKVLKFVLGDANKDKFIQQIKSANVIYIHGGNTLLLNKHLSKIENFNKLIQDKVIVGSCAGAKVLGKYSYSENRSRVEANLGILSIKIFCHYAKEKVNKLKKLKEYKEDLKTYTIPEGKYYVINI